MLQTDLQDIEICLGRMTCSQSCFVLVCYQFVCYQPLLSLVYVEFRHTVAAPHRRAIRRVATRQLELPQKLVTGLCVTLSGNLNSTQQCVLFTKT